MSAALLEVHNVTAGYGNIPVLHGVSLDVRKGEIVTLIGANGAGKTTLMMTICGRPRARMGDILFEGHRITARSTYEIARLRIAQSPEGRRIFPRMTVLENLQMGALIAKDPQAFDTDLERVCTLFPVLKKRRSQRGGTLSGGEQQMLAIGRILRTGARLLLLDEPTEGLAPVIVQQIGATIRRLKAEGFTILLVEQNLKFASSIADRHYVMDRGRVVDEIPADRFQSSMPQLQTHLGV